MNQESYLEEIKSRLVKIYQNKKNNFHHQAKERYKLEGFMQGAIFIGFANEVILEEIIDEEHLEVFNETLKERERQAYRLKREEFRRRAITPSDYSEYEIPAYQRMLE